MWWHMEHKKVEKYGMWWLIMKSIAELNETETSDQI